MGEAGGPAGGEAIVRWYRAALAAVEPGAAVARHLARAGDHLVLDGEPISIPGRLLVAAIGKAAVPMARAVETIAGELISGGLVITKEGHATGPLPRLPVREAGHPIPDERGVAATRELLDLVAEAGAVDVVLALISGGGSALLEAPVPPVTLADLAATTDLLLKAGAPIQELNAVRTPLSRVKGGGLRRVAPAARFLTLILSDVLGNDLRVIASGPTIPGAYPAATALATLSRYDLLDRVPPAVRHLLEARAASDDRVPAVPAVEDRIVVVADNETAIAAAEATAAAEGRQVRVIWRDQQGEAADLGRTWAIACHVADETVDVLLGGGEATVTVRGNGLGGRNTEFALAAALALAEMGETGWAIASLATDGQDGPTDAAGAIADGETVARARAAGVDPARALAENDSLRVFQAAGGLVAPGPTGTNVNDLYFAVRLRPPAR